MINKTQQKRLELIAPRDKKGNELVFSIDDFKALDQTARIAERRTNRIALELVLNMTMRDALTAAYLQGFNDAQISC
jgi:hypothetical protein